MIKDRQQKLFSSQLRLAAEIWQKIVQDPQPADRWLARYFFQHRKKIGSRDRRFLSETIYSAFRNKSFLEAWTGKASTHPLVTETEKAERMCFFAAAKEGLVAQQEFCGSSGQNEKVYTALQKHLLPDARIPRSQEETMALFYSFPLWLVERWAKTFGMRETESLLGFFQKRPLLVLRANTLKISREKLIDKFRKAGIEAEQTTRSRFGLILKERQNVFDTPAFRDGWFEIQDEGSQLIGQKMDPQPGENVWDVCAGGGGKSLLLAAIMENRGRIVATDIRSYKLEDLKKRAKRAGVFNIFPADLERISELKLARKGFGKILVDAPCSGTGTLSRNPDAKWKLNESWFAKLQKEQLGILEKALPYLAKNGKLYYATCSIEMVENEEVVRKFLEHHPEFKTVPCGERGEPYFKLWPPESATDGFFLAILEKT